MVRCEGRAHLVEYRSESHAVLAGIQQELDKNGLRTPENTIVEVVTILNFLRAIPGDRLRPTQRETQDGQEMHGQTHRETPKKQKSHESF
jgi:hypothetical protein